VTKAAVSKAPRAPAADFFAKRPVVKGKTKGESSKGSSSSKRMDLEIPEIKEGSPVDGVAGDDDEDGEDELSDEEQDEQENKAAKKLYV
jgi:hypothetical protein